MESESKKLSLIQWLIELNDEETLNKIEALKDKHSHLTEAQNEVLKARLESYRNGTMQSAAWEDVMDRVRKNIK